MNWVKYDSYRGNTWRGLLDIRHRWSHKVPGFLYIVLALYHLYVLIFDFHRFLENGALFSMTFPLLGCVMAISAAANFELPRNGNNSGMFKDRRTMSRAFVLENLFFQLLLGHALMPYVPALDKYFSPNVEFLLFFMVMFSRELFPKTSYSDWAIRDDDSAFSPAQRTFVNAQVKIVRWNFVWKGLLGYYFWSAMVAYRLRGMDAPLTEMDFRIHHLSIFDALLNISVSIFLQTLKFKGFIRATTFSVAFNSTVLTMGLLMTGLFFTTHQFVVNAFVMACVDVFVNLYVIYPQSWSHKNKGRAKAFLRLSCFMAVVVTL